MNKWIIPIFANLNKINIIKGELVNLKGKLIINGGIPCQNSNLKTQLKQ